MYTLSIFEPTSTIQIIFTVLGGSGMFLFGIEFMSSSLKSLSGNKMKLLIEKATNNIFLGILTGLSVTVLIQSSSATTVIVIGLISAGLMSLKQAIGVMMGANIGTTITAFLVGLNVNDYSLIFVAIGAAIVIFISTKKVKLTGGIILGFGLLFAGLEFMSLGLSPIINEPWFTSAMISLSENSILGVLAGTLLSAIVQSSSATIAVLQQIFSDGGIPLRGAIAVLLGCNIGTTITAILASLSAPREAKQASIFHLLFNLLGTVIILIIFSPFVDFLVMLEKKILGPNNKMTIALAHVTFNTITTLILVFFIKYIVKFIQKILPVKEQVKPTIAEKLNYDLIQPSPILALETTKSVVLEMGQIAIDMVNLARTYQNIDNSDYFYDIGTLEDKIDFYDNSIHDHLMEIQTTELSPKNKQYQIILLDTIRDFERIADHAVNLSEFYKSRHELNCPLTGSLGANLNMYFDLVLGQVHDALNCFKNNDKSIAKKIILTETEVDKLEKIYRRAQLLDKETCDCNDIHYVDILSNLERISDHCNNIAENIIDPHYLSKERLNPFV